MQTSVQISRRFAIFGGLATACKCWASTGIAPISRGCVRFEAGNAQRSNGDFVGLRRGNGDQSEIALGPLVIELMQLLEILAALGFYDDSGSCKGNAGADPRNLFPPVPSSLFKTEGTIVLGTKLLETLSRFQYETAATAAVCAHEFGHLLQYKYLKGEFDQIIKQEQSVVRAELFADFVCGYHAGIRKTRQEEYPAAIQALNQFRMGDHLFGWDHHGTPEERAKSVEAGFAIGSRGKAPPESVARLGLQYVTGIILQPVHSYVCESVERR